MTTPVEFGTASGPCFVDWRPEWHGVYEQICFEAGNLDATEIHEAERAAVLAALSAPGSKARNERGQLGISKFKAIGKLRWRRP